MGRCSNHSLHWNRSVFLFSFTYRLINVLFFWYFINDNVNVNGVDVASSGISEVKETWESLKKNYTADFFQADPCSVCPFYILFFTLFCTLFFTGLTSKCFCLTGKFWNPVAGKGQSSWFSLLFAEFAGLKLLRMLMIFFLRGIFKWEMFCYNCFLQLCFETEESARKLLHNVASLLKPGGYFFGITPDSSTIWYE